MHKLWNVQSELVCAHWHLVVSNCVYESIEGRWSGDESVLAAIWEAIFMQRNSDIMGKMCLSIQEYGRFSLEQLVSILSGDMLLLLFPLEVHYKSP